MHEVMAPGLHRPGLPMRKRIRVHVAGVLTLAWAAIPTLVLAADPQPGVQRSSTVVFLVVILLVASLTAGIFFASPLRKRLRPGAADVPDGARSGLVDAHDGLPAMPGGLIAPDGQPAATSGNGEEPRRAWPRPVDVAAPQWPVTSGYATKSTVPSDIPAPTITRERDGGMAGTLDAGDELHAEVRPADGDGVLTPTEIPAPSVERKDGEGPDGWVRAPDTATWSTKATERRRGWSAGQ